MAKLKYAYPIDEVHGKLKGKFGAAQRKKANAKGQRDGYSVNYGTRSTDYSTAEVANHNRFKAIQTLVATHRNTLSQRSADQAAFKAQSTYPTLTKYLWAICTAEYTASLTQN